MLKICRLSRRNIGFREIYRSPLKGMGNIAFETLCDCEYADHSQQVLTNFEYTVSSGRGRFTQLI